MGDIQSKIKEEMARLNAGSDPLIKAKVREYVEAVENGEPLFATELDNSYRKIAEFGGIVLAGRRYTEPRNGYQFVTWEKGMTSDNKPMVRYGEYFHLDDQDIFNRAKVSFATRSGLIDETLLFTPLQYAAMLHAVQYIEGDTSAMDDYYLEELSGMSTQLERIVRGDGMYPNEQGLTME
jgi:hypothetical protein